MKLYRDDLTLYFVTNKDTLKNRSLEDMTLQAIQGGATIVQYREKHKPFSEMVKECRNLSKICHDNNVKFVINDHVDLASIVPCDGVHIGQDDRSIEYAKTKLKSNQIIGVSVFNEQEAILAEQKGADYLGVGTIFPTSSKLDAKDVSIDSLRAICQAVNIPVVAIGGITKDNIKKLQNTKINGVAVISAIIHNEDIKQATKDLYEEAANIVNFNTLLCDLDGTLIDSLSFYKKLSYYFLKSIDVEMVPSDEEIINQMSFNDSVKYLKERYQLELSTKDIKNRLINLVDQYYKYTARPFLNTILYLKKEYEKGHKIYIFTATYKANAQNVIKLLQIEDMIDGIITVEDYQDDKHEPNTIQHVLQKINKKHNEVIIIDDDIRVINTCNRLQIKTIHYNVEKEGVFHE